MMTARLEMSDTTNISLLERLRQDFDDTAWQRMVELYTPLIRRWLRRYALAEQDVDDLVQDVLAVVVRKLPDFQKQPRVGAFRRWLRTITVNCMRELWRSQKYRPTATGDAEFAKILDQLEDSASGPSRLWDREHDQFVTRRLLAQIRPRFEEKTWHAFLRVALQSEAIDDVAEDLDMTVNAVFIAKSRVLQALRQEGQGLIDN
jgi:RNA polymerase sigma-70 factor (ECF subfamily)